MDNLYVVFNHPVSQVEGGINLTTQQLDELDDLINHDDYVNVTGLKEAIQTYVEQHRDDNDADLARLQAEKATVDELESDIDNYDCPCVWGQWGAWDSCSVTCGGSTHYRYRDITRNKTNNGAECTGDNYDTQACGTDPCRKLTFMAHVHCCNGCFVILGLLLSCKENYETIEIGYYFFSN